MRKSGAGWRRRYLRKKAAGLPRKLPRKASRRGRVVYAMRERARAAGR
ncbi:hypothetical protein KBTX_01686 [wastewater metagenome]|uniref:Uncharacterized protein n=2 Tax=unclassified sequences TaxID=12908 RepID=A0A5B8REV1_9ZZZZ|nr:hypothetical protein KBTEX_01686 [uncultured organism]